MPKKTNQPKSKGQHRIRVRMKGLVMIIKGTPEQLDETLKGALQFIGNFPNSK